MSSVPTARYAGDVAPREAWASLESDARAILVDVRTRAEWGFVGLPSLVDLGKQALTIEWQVFPSMAENPDFVGVLGSALDEAGIARDAPIFFLCRSGVRSRSAAVAMTEAGWASCWNISGGFEGPPDPQGHRGSVAGWKAEGLPWTQS